VELTRTQESEGLAKTRSRVVPKLRVPDVEPCYRLRLSHVQPGIIRALGGLVPANALVLTGLSIFLLVGKQEVIRFLPFARYSGIIPRSPPLGREGGHFNVVTRRGRHWAVHQPSARSQHGIAWTPLTAPIWPVSQGSFWRSATLVALTLRSCT